MKHLTTILFSALVLITTVSCRHTQSLTIMPTAVSTVHSTSFKELNLTSNDYEILNRVEAQASVIVEYDDDEYTISDPEGSFKMNYEKYEKQDGTYGYRADSYKGVLRVGFLSNDYKNEDLDMGAESIVRALATYRLINLVKEQGGDGIIEPVISTNVEESSSGKITFQSTVSGKVVRLKSKK